MNELHGLCSDPEQLSHFSPIGTYAESRRQRHFRV